MSIEVVIARPPAALWRDTPSSLLVLAPGDDVVRLAGAGRELWLALDEPSTLPALAVEVARRSSGTAAPAAPAAPDVHGVERFVTELRALGLVVDVPS
ncbi:MAG TPA: hypothetical protein VIJ47_09110 [Acidimicrobiales bacterium]